MGGSTKRRDACIHSLKLKEEIGLVAEVDASTGRPVGDRVQWLPSVSVIFTELNHQL